MLGLIGSAIGALGSMFTSSQNRDAQAQANAQNLAYQNMWNTQNIELQKEFAQQGVRWKVEDAKAAGLHPLAALGAQTTSFSPVTVGEPFKATTSENPFSSFGQDFSRAEAAGSTASERTDKVAQALGTAAGVAQVQKLNLENELLKTQIAKQTAQLGPPFPANWMDFVQGSGSPRSGPDRTFSGEAVTPDDIKQKADSIPALKQYRILGLPVTAHPWVTDANDLENRGGEGWGDAIGAINPLIDLAYTYGSPVRDALTRKYGPDFFELAKTRWPNQRPRSRRTRPWGD